MVTLETPVAQALAALAALAAQCLAMSLGATPQIKVLLIETQLNLASSRLAQGAFATVVVGEAVVGVVLALPMMGDLLPEVM